MIEKEIIEEVRLELNLNVFINSIVGKKKKQNPRPCARCWQSAGYKSDEPSKYLLAPVLMQYMI